jgi:hypothetical protein
MAGPVLMYVQAPVDDVNPQWGLTGQNVSIKSNVMATIKDVKEQLSPMLGGMPVNKMQLKTQAHGFLKDSSTLAAYNIGNNAVIELLTRSRGGRR